MKVLFAGSPGIAVPSLVKLCNTEGIEIAGVLTNADTAKGRHGTPQPTEVGEAALGLQNVSPFPVIKPLKLDACAREYISSLKPDLLVSFAYGRIFGPKFLAIFPLGGINIHPSLLPKYRGPSPVQAAILNRDTVTGISIQKLAVQMDSGDILSSMELELTGKETSVSLSSIIAVTAADMLPDVLKKIADGTVKPVKQNHNLASYCSLIKKDDGIIDWSRSAFQIEAKIRAFDIWPLCRTIHNGRELIILKADVYKGDHSKGAQYGQVLGTDKNNGILIQTGDGILSVTELQYQSKKALHWRDFLNGARDFAGYDHCTTVLGQ
ncbi:MAG: methionyl-tRNA formyltransferase [Treponema sp.]|nr:methionyl-tRNA formyltransferase [Treponema sp.]